MNNTKQFFIGIDVSKLTFDAAMIMVENHQKGSILTARFENTAPGLKAFAKWLKANGLTTPASALVVMENTGFYHRRLWLFCEKHNIPVHIGNAAQIKWSLGIIRGKDDTTDSIRLCKYACKQGDELKNTPALNTDVVRLKDLQTSRTRLIKQLTSNRVYLGELKGVSDPLIYGAMEKAYKAAIEGLEKSIAVIEEQIKSIVAKDASLKQNYKLLISVPGIGHVTAIYLLCCTANFAAKPTGKQLACYAGVAPFGYSSGTSIRGRAKVHKMANKELKRLLYMGARAAVQHNVEMKAYYERKKGEGKHDLTVINAVKNKIILRVAAVIARQRPFVRKAAIAA